tara:strand:- start:398 stop:631 length:234 start_codon:yes stop_codon:yes gene_type:complete
MSETKSPELNTNEEALALALELAVTAPSERQSMECLAMAEQIAGSMSAAAVEIVKAEVDIKLGLGSETGGEKNAQKH